MDLPGPDGFLLAPSDPLRNAHLRLNEFLLAEEQRDPNSPIDAAPWRKVPKRELPGLTLAILCRMQWLGQHDADLDTAHLSRIRLVRLLRVLYTIKWPANEPELVSLVDATTPLLDRIAPFGPVERVGDYLRTGDLTPELCHALRTFQTALRDEGSGSQTSLQSLRQTLHMLLWMDEWEPLDPERCWSECVRRDFREMSGERRVKWRVLLKHLRGNAPVRMPKGWVKDATPLLAAVGIEDFREKFASWFMPFRSGVPLPLSVPGSHVLKGLIWYCAVANDEEAREIALWLLEVKWRQKRNTEKSLVALTELGITREELASRQLIKERAPDPMPNYMQRLGKSLALTTTDRIAASAEGDLLIVQGQLHFYRISRETGRIDRASDNAVLELDWHSLPDQFRLMINRECDSPHQVQMRAFLLMNDGVFAKYFKESPAQKAGKNK
ncbi:MAG: hypothetical protein JST28_07400 [Acidobacteria bacterium]|nr:hypothetical protein [Acidobacteriota bacterium]